MSKSLNTYAPWQKQDEYVVIDHKEHELARKHLKFNVNGVEERTSFSRNFS